MVEFGIFNDEGCIERGFITQAAAEEAILANNFEYGQSVADEMCPDHDEQPRNGCEDCDADGGEGDDDDL